jgi:hypothetical protein
LKVVKGTKNIAKQRLYGILTLEETGETVS